MSRGLRKGHIISHDGPSNTCSIPETTEVRSSLTLETACSTSYDRLTTRPSASNDPYHKSNAVRSPVARHPSEKCNEKGETHLTMELNEETRTCRPIFPSFQSASREFLPGTGPHFLWIVCQPQSVCKIVDQHTRTAYVVETAPTQNPHSRVTSDQASFESSSPSSVRPLTSLSAQASASLFCSRKNVYRPVTNSSTQIHAFAPPIPQLFLGSSHGSNCRLLHCLAIDPFDHRLAALLISSSIHSVFVRSSSTKGSRSLGPLLGMPPGFFHQMRGCPIIFTRAAITSSFRGRINFRVQSSSALPIFP